MNGKGQIGHTISGTFVFLLLGIFAVCSTGMVVLSIQAYHSAEERSQEHNDARILASYVRSMLRAEDGYASVYMLPGQDSDQLVLEHDYDGDIYLTRIYCSGGNLREWFYNAQTPFVPDEGEAICDALELRANTEGGLVTVRIRSPQDEWIETVIHVYSGMEETDFVFGSAGAEFTKSSSENSKSEYKSSI